MIRFLLFLLLAAIMADWILTGCTTPPRTPLPLRPVTLVSHVTHHAGSPLDGPGNRSPESPALASALRVRFAVFGLEKMPGHAFSPLGASSRLVVEESDSPLLPAVRLASGTRFTTCPDAAAFQKALASLQSGRNRLLATEWGVLPAGTTSVLALTGDSAFPRNRRRPPPCRIRVMVHRPKGPSPNDVLQAALGMQVLANAASHSAQDRGELVLVDADALKGRNHLVFLLPSPFPRDWPRALAVGVEVTAAPDSSDPFLTAWKQAVSRCQDDLAAAAPPSAPSGREPGPPGLAAVLDGLTWRERRRDALDSLARAAGADLTRDLLYILPSGILRSLAEEVHDLAGSERSREGSDGISMDTLAWFLDRTAVRLLAGKLDQESLSPELEAILVRHTGEVARHPDLIKEFADAARNRKDFHALVLEENRHFLKNVSPASRIRAHDWLAGQGAALEGYDPLAPADARRQALRRSALGGKP